MKNKRKGEIKEKENKLNSKVYPSHITSVKTCYDIMMLFGDDPNYDSVMTPHLYKHCVCDQSNKKVEGRA